MNLKITGLLIILTLGSLANADSYSCAKMVYKDGWLKTYEYKGNTWGANTKKHGAVSSTVGSSTETTTGSVDPGVTTGHVMSTIQHSSSWGECSMLDYFVTKQMRDDYIKQNMHDIKKHVALGEGHHVDSLAFLSGCQQISKAVWTSGLRLRIGELYDSQNPEQVSELIDGFIQSEPDLKSFCSYSRS